VNAGIKCDSDLLIGADRNESARFGAESKVGPCDRRAPLPIIRIQMHECAN